MRMMIGELLGRRSERGMVEWGEMSIDDLCFLPWFAKVPHSIACLWRVAFRSVLFCSFLLGSNQV
jgi:hypothetical protein